MNKEESRLIELDISSLEATKQLSSLVANALEESVVIALSGDLGAGKTTFVQYLAEALGVEEVVTSPTFTMMNEYHSGRIPLYHIDLYRVGESIDKAERENKATKKPSLDHFVLEFEEILDSNSVIVIEWPKYFLVEGENYLDNICRLEIKIKTPRFNDLKNNLDQARSLQLVSNGGEAKKLLDRLILKIDQIEEISIVTRN